MKYATNMKYSGMPILRIIFHNDNKNDDNNNNNNNKKIIIVKYTK